MFKIKNLTVKNFMSVGNATQGLDFDRSDLTLVLGVNIDLGGDDSGARNGTGKTTIVEGLAKRIVEGDVPENIKERQLITMDLSAMVAGAMYKGQFEERLKNFVDAVKEQNGDIIIFIDSNYNSPAIIIKFINII